MSRVSLNGRASEEAVSSRRTQPKITCWRSGRRWRPLQRGWPGAGRPRLQPSLLRDGAWAVRHPGRHLHTMQESTMDSTERMCPHKACTSTARRAASRAIVVQACRGLMRSNWDVLSSESGTTSSKRAPVAWTPHSKPAPLNKGAGTCTSVLKAKVRSPAILWCSSPVWASLCCTHTSNNCTCSTGRFLEPVNDTACLQAA